MPTGYLYKINWHRYTQYTCNNEPLGDSMNVNYIIDNTEMLGTCSFADTEHTIEF